MSGWTVWGLPAFAQIVAPWQEKLTSMKLISDYFQPELNVGASVLGAIACFATFAWLQRKSQQLVSKVILFASLLFFMVLLLCIFLKFTIDVSMFPGPEMHEFVRFMWITAYLLVFVLLGISMTSAGVAIHRREAARQGP